MKKFYFIIFVLLIGCSSDSDNNSNETPTIIETGLKDIAISKGKFIGNLMRDGFFDDHQIYNGEIDNILKTEYNALVTGNKLKMVNLLKIYILTQNLIGLKQQKKNARQQEKVQLF